MHLKCRDEGFDSGFALVASSHTSVCTRFGLPDCATLIAGGSCCRDGVWLTWGDHQASEIVYMPSLFLPTELTGIYSGHLATSTNYGIFAFCSLDGPRGYLDG
ncbi:uncharacterized protein N7525_010162 [Penicillium rubens]|jgi:hypothetical protein|uniref:uncharacterized protein n=1 Tax=Penicillium rubens TaxID=1108849 RepID=UPI002A5A489D|nr:uncharacterized protein N7525_010162 [Penicillium rubens]KAJ5820878.1 hypothetical protein N7525_010162 [Penicillium rubens]